MKAFSCGRLGKFFFCKIYINKCQLNLFLALTQKTGAEMPILFVSNVELPIINVIKENDII
jgi:hypothetical protein